MSSAASQSLVNLLLEGGVASREEALTWAAKIAVACRCAQQVFELLPDDAYAE